MDLLNYLGGPVIGAAIGFCTNYIAVKMLFYPRKEIRVFGHRLPFTPGAIPKGQPRLAKAIGTVIENNLLTKADIEAKLLSEEAETRVAGAVMEMLSGNIREELCAVTGLDGDAYDRKKASACEEVSRQIVRAVQTSGVTEQVMNELAASLRERASGTAWRVLVNSRTIDSVMGPAKERLDRAIDRHGAEYIAPILERELDKTDGGTGLELLERFDQDEQSVRDAVIRAYRRLVDQYAEDLLKHFHVARLVEDKINAMSVQELEKLVWGVMRKELNTIISLGGLIGLVLGLLNVWL